MGSNTEQDDLAEAGGWIYGRTELARKHMRWRTVSEQGVATRKHPWEKQSSLAETESLYCFTHSFLPPAFAENRFWARPVLCPGDSMLLRHGKGHRPCGP